KYLFILVYFVLSYGASGQNLELIHNLKNQLTSADQNKRFEILNDLAWEYRWALPDSTIFYAEIAYDLGKGLNLTKNMAEPLNFIGVAYNYKGDRLKAFEYYEQALNVSIQQRDSAQIAYTNNNLGRLFFEQGVLGRSYE